MQLYREQFCFFSVGHLDIDEEELYHYRGNLSCRYDGWITEMQENEAKNVNGQPKGIDNLLYSADAGASLFFALPRL